MRTPHWRFNEAKQTELQLSLNRYTALSGLRVPVPRPTNAPTASTPVQQTTMPDLQNAVWNGYGWLRTPSFLAPNLPLTLRLPTDSVQHFARCPRVVAGRIYSGGIGSPNAPTKEPLVSQRLNWIKLLLTSAKSQWRRNIPVLTRTNLELPDETRQVSSKLF